MCYEAVSVATHTRLIYKQIGNFLCVQNGLSRLVDVSLAIIIKRKLNFIYPVGDAEPRVDDAFDYGDDFLVGRLDACVIK